MRCECCDSELSDAEASAKFEDSGSYVQMCTECQQFLPPEVKVKTRKHLLRNKEKEREVNPDVDIDSPFFYPDGDLWEDS